MWVSKKKWQATERRLAHIESLLQRMPEMVAAAYLIEKEKKKRIHTRKSNQRKKGQKLKRKYIKKKR